MTKIPVVSVFVESRQRVRVLLLDSRQRGVMVRQAWMATQLRPPFDETRADVIRMYAGPQGQNIIKMGLL